MTRIYRIENDDGHGPWKGACSAMRSEHSHPPGPTSDYGLRELWKMIETEWDFAQSPYLFGFANVERMKRWFSDADHYSEFDADGFHVSIYEVDDAEASCFHGEWQSIFRRDNATLKERRPMVEFA